MITSAMIAPAELPIWERKTIPYRITFGAENAQMYCQMLIGTEAFDTLTDTERREVARVATGEMWTVPETVYTQSDWERDGTLCAVAGQEIEESIYWEMFNVLPPFSLPRNERTAGYDAGFLCSEPHSFSPLGMTYSGFGRKDGRYYYLGLIARTKGGKAK